MVMRDTFSRLAKLALAGALILLAADTNAAPITYANRVLADGPIGYWRLGEMPPGTTAADSSGGGNNGTYSGGVTLGQPGFHDGDTAALFDGRTGRVVVPNSVSLNPAFITMEAKVGWLGPNGFQQRILEKSSYAELAQYGLNILEDGRVRVEIRTTATPGVPDAVCGSGWSPSVAVVCANSVALVAKIVETHIVATFDGKRIRIYLNGILDSETPALGNAGNVSPKPPPSQGSDLGIGNQAARDRPFNGVIDEVALFGKPLTGDQALAHFQSQLEQPPGGGFEYAVKFVCGKSDGRVVAPGEYFTAINVHNPNAKVVGFKKKFAIALPGEKPGKISKFFDARLGPDEAFEIDCPDIFRRTEANVSFLKGFAVIESPMELDVVAVYTAAGSTGKVETMELERVNPRRVGGGGDCKPDLIPMPDVQGQFCRVRDGKLIVTVKNQGCADAGPSVTRVDFSSGTVSQPTPGLAAGASVDLLFAIPPGCFQPDCGFKITVDSNGQVGESNEANNTATGACIG
jgi:hypothetical protein